MQDQSFKQNPEDANEFNHSGALHLLKRQRVWRWGYYEPG